MLHYARYFILATGFILSFLENGHTTADATLPLVRGFSGMQGSMERPRLSGDSFEASERLVMNFSHPIQKSSLAAVLTVEPAITFRLSGLPEGTRYELNFLKVPGQTYSIHIGAGIQVDDGRKSTDSETFLIRTAHVRMPTVQAPLNTDPYRYGMLEHPWPKFLGGPDAARQITYLAKAGVQFVRIDYCGDVIEPAQGRFDWVTTDSIASNLAAHGITELPIILQYCAPSWSTGGEKYPTIWGSPVDYAAFAGAVALHISQVHSNIGRIELFNEPNLRGWWRATNSQYIDRTGRGAAPYMRAAYVAIKAASPRLRVVGPALADGGDSVDPRLFLESLYDAGCGRGKCWDLLSVHNYSWMNPTFTVSRRSFSRFNIYQDLIDIAKRHGDYQCHVMLTEWGYSTKSDSPNGFDPLVQAEYLALGLNLLTTDPLVDGVVYVNLYNPGNDFWADTSLLDRDYNEKPAFRVFEDFAKSGGEHQGATNFLAPVTKHLTTSAT